MKNKVFSVLVLSGIITLGVCTKAYAQTDAYLVKDNSKGVVYSFDKEELTESFLDMKDGENSVLYNEYMKVFSKNGLYAFHDTTQKYIEYSEVEEAFLDAKDNGRKFDVDNYTEKVGKAMTTIPTKIKKVTAPNNKIVYTEVNTGSSSSEEVGDLEVISIE